MALAYSLLGRLQDCTELYCADISSWCFPCLCCYASIHRRKPIWPGWFFGLSPLPWAHGEQGLHAFWGKPSHCKFVWTLVSEECSIRAARSIRYGVIPLIGHGIVKWTTHNYNHNRSPQSFPCFHLKGSLPRALSFVASAFQLLHRRCLRAAPQLFCVKSISAQHPLRQLMFQLRCPFRQVRLCNPILFYPILSADMGCLFFLAVLQLFYSSAKYPVEDE